MPIAFHRLTEDEKAAICAEFEAGARVGEIDSAHDITPHCRKRVLTEAGFAEVSGSVPVEKRVRFGAAAPSPLAQRPPPPPPPPPQRKRVRSVSISSAASHSVQDFHLDDLLESDLPEAGAPLKEQVFTTSPLPEYVGHSAGPRPQHDAETDFSDGASDEGTVCSVTPSETAELNGAILEATAPSRAQAASDPERDMLLLQCRMYAMEFAEVLGPQLIGQTKSARARWIKNLASYDKQALRQTLEKCEMIVGGSNAHALMKGGLSMGCRAAEMVGGMVGFQLEGYHDQMVMSPAVDGLLRELRIKHIGQLSAVLSPEQRLMGVLLMGIVATDSQNRFRAAHDAELRKPVASDLPDRYAAL